MSARSDNRWHDRVVDNTKPIDAVDAAVRVDDRSRIVGSTDPAAAGWVVYTCGSFANDVRKRIEISH